MTGPPKKKRAPAKSALQRNAERIYELDKDAQEQFSREARRLVHEFWRTGNKKHLVAAQRHLDGWRAWRPKRACLETGRPMGALMYELKLVEIIGEESSRSKGNARQPRNKKGGSAQ